MKWLKKLIPIAVIIAIVVGWKVYNKNQAIRETLGQAAVIVQSFPRYTENSTYYDSLLEEIHGKAFDGAYTYGGRRSSSKFDQDKYVAFLVALYHRQANKDGKSDIADDLEEHRKALGLPVVEFN